MSPHVDILEDRDSLRRSFLGSIAFHVLLVAAIAGVGLLRSHSALSLGVENPGGGVGGSVAITPVGSIPLPTNEGPRNPVARDTKSQVPVPKEPPKPVAKPKPEPPKKVDPNALPVPGGFTKKQYAQVDKFRDKQRYQENQLYSTAGQALSSDMFAIAGGRMGLGPNQPFGTQFGAYAEILRSRVANAWRTADIDASVRTAPMVTVTFTLHRDGSATDLRVTKTSGVGALDRSALRAIRDAAPFPRVPPAFPKDQTDIDFIFELKR